MSRNVFAHTPPIPPGWVCEHTAGPGGFARANNAPPETWVLSFKAEGDGGPPVEIRVRRLLKRALRSFGLRCVDFRVAAPASEPAAAAAAAAVVEGGAGR
jgi:hypothetical protein